MFRPLPHKKGSLTIYLLLLIVAPALMVALRQCSVKGIGERREAIAGGDTINVAIEISPMGVTISGDTLGGYYYDIMRQLASAHGRQLRFHPFTQLKTALEGLDEGRYQVVVSDIPATAEMKGRYLFVQPGEIDRQVLVQRKDSTGTMACATQFDLGGKHVTVPHNSPFISRLRNLSHEIGDTIYVAEDSRYSSEQLIIMTAIGEIDNVVVSARVAEPLLRRYPNLDASLHVSFNQFQGWAMSPRDSILHREIAGWFKGQRTIE